MIVVIGRYPDKTNERDGMVQRIKSIDDHVLSEKKRIYLEISFRSFWTPVKKHPCESIDVYKVNFFLHIPFIIRTLKKAKHIYVHSIYNAWKIIYYYFFTHKIITDMHGVSVEELKMAGEFVKAKRFNWVEKIVVKHSQKLVVVTHAMGHYYKTKYGMEDNKKFLYISIFDDYSHNHTYNSKNTNKAIYSGGAQVWQCIPRLLQCIERTKKKIQWTILSGDKDFFNKNIKDKNNITIKSVKKEAVYSEYDRNTFGLVLRDDNIVNRVACPTKLVEYIQAGLIPVVKSPYIGDFNVLGYNYVKVEDLEKFHVPNLKKIAHMAQENKQILAKIRNEAQRNLTILRETLR